MWAPAVTAVEAALLAIVWASGAYLATWLVAGRAVGTDRIFGHVLYLLAASFSLGLWRDALGFNNEVFYRRPSFGFAAAIGCTFGVLLAYLHDLQRTRKARRQGKIVEGAGRISTVARVVGVLIACEMCTTALWFGAWLHPDLETWSAQPRTWTLGLPVAAQVFLIGLVYGQLVTGALVAATDQGLRDWGTPRRWHYGAMALPVATSLLFVTIPYPGLLIGVLVRGFVLAWLYFFTREAPMGTVGAARLAARMWSSRRQRAAGVEGRDRAA